VDEGLWNSGTIVPISTSDAGLSYPTKNGAPAIVRLSDGTFDVVATSAATNPTRLDAWHVDAALGALGSATLTTDPSPSCSQQYLWPSIATDGNKIVASTLFVASGCGGYAGNAKYIMAGGNLASPTVSLLATSPYSYLWPYVSPSTPVIAYNGAAFAVAWADTHATGDPGTALVYVGTMSTSGVVSNIHTITGTLADQQVYTINDNARVYLAMGSTSALVAYRSKSTGHARFWIMDTSLAATIAGPLDYTANSDETSAMGVAHVGSSFAFATQYSDGKTVRLHRIDDRTGATLATVVVTNPSAGTDTYLEADVQMTAVGSGFGLTMSRGSNVAFGWMREDFVGGPVLTEVLTGSSTSSRIAAVDAKHVAMVWTDGVVKGTMLTCAP
jgi:hypothetical protein